MTTILEALSALDLDRFPIADTLELAPRLERRLAPPRRYLEGHVGNWLSEQYQCEGTLWRHQSLALSAAEQGRNVVVATETASGKSLVFYATAMEALCRDANARFIAFYPQIALTNDQLQYWQSAALACGFPKEIVGQIYGAVPTTEREAILARARIILMTPDVCQAWFLRNLSLPTVQDYLRLLSTIFLDEAHVFDGVMGSNVAFLLRRLSIVRSVIREERVSPVHIVAASATIANPAEHLHALCGAEAEVISTDDDGSPSYQKTLLHFASADPHAMAVELLGDLLDRSETGTFIAFADSRQGVERIAEQLDHEGVRPYRSGYEKEDRRGIEVALSRGELRGVVSTSALELGINIPYFTVGFNIGIPQSRKALRQRVGRVGRSAPAAFGIIAEAEAFSRFGSSLQEYWNGSIEPSFLYLDNRFIQYANARCLVDELDALGRKPKPLPEATWPSGFPEVYTFAEPGGGRPAQFDAIHAIGGDNPHQNYPLRDVGETRFVLKLNDSSLGEITLQQAIREAYPGAIYRHMNPYRVTEWRTTVFDRMIRLMPAGYPGQTKPIIKTFVNVALETAGIVDGHYLGRDGDFMAECLLQITERVEGYSEHGKQHRYHDIRFQKPNYRAQTREVRTTGVIFRSQNAWFRENKRAFAAALKDLLLREYSISPQDIDVTETNISLVRADGRTPIADAVAVFDRTYGSLRLSERAFTDVRTIAMRLLHSVELAGEDALVPASFAREFYDWVSSLAPDQPEDVSIESGLYRIFAPDSIVARKGVVGPPVDTRILAPELFDDGESVTLAYRCKDLVGGRESICKHTAILIIGDDWREAVWDPITNVITEDEPGAAAVDA